MEWRRARAAPPTEPLLDQYPSWNELELTELDPSLPYPYEIRVKSGPGVSPLCKHPAGFYTNDCTVFNYFRDVVAVAVSEAHRAIRGQPDDDAVRSASKALRLSRHETVPDVAIGQTIVGTTAFSNTLVGVLYFLAAYKLPIGSRCPAFTAVLRRPPYREERGPGCDSGRVFEAVAADVLARIDSGKLAPWDTADTKPGATCEQRARSLRTAELLAQRCGWKTEETRFHELLAPRISDLPVVSPITISSVWSAFLVWARDTPDPFSFDGV